MQSTSGWEKTRMFICVYHNKVGRRNWVIILLNSRKKRLVTRIVKTSYNSFQLTCINSQIRQTSVRQTCLSLDSSSPCRNYMLTKRTLRWVKFALHKSHFQCLPIHSPRPKDDLTCKTTKKAVCKRDHIPKNMCSKLISIDDRTVLGA